MPEQKELGFFDQDKLYRQGEMAYRRCFQSATDEAAIGEATPRYLMKGKRKDSFGEYVYDPQDDAPTRIASLLPDLKSILTLRNPVTRAYSQYRKGMAKGTETAATFREALESELRGQRTATNSIRALIYTNTYSIHLARWLELFPSDRVHIVLFESWVSEPETAYQKLCRFLDIDDHFCPASFDIHNAGKRTRLGAANELSDADIGFARNVFAADIETLETSFGLDLSAWK